MTREAEGLNGAKIGLLEDTLVKEMSEERYR